MIFRLQLVRDQSKEKPLELEMGWLCAETEWKHALVPKELVLEADKIAVAAVEGSAAVESEGAAEEKTMEVEI